MEYYIQPDAPSKKDKKRATIQAKLAKLDQDFDVDRDYYFTNTLKQLQNQLMSAHEGRNETVLEKIHDFEEERDYELIRLSLWQQYEVERSSKELVEDMENANKEHDEMVKLVKERLYSSLETQVKQLKEDKVLLDVANSYSMELSAEFQKHTRSQKEPLAGYLSDRRGLRRRFLNTTDEDVSANESGNNSNKKSRMNTSADESWLSDTGDLNSLLYGKKEKHRHLSKSYNPPQGLKSEEVADDLAILKSSI